MLDARIAHRWMLVNPPIRPIKTLWRSNAALRWPPALQFSCCRPWSQSAGFAKMRRLLN